MHTLDAIYHPDCGLTNKTRELRVERLSEKTEYAFDKFIGILSRIVLVLVSASPFVGAGLFLLSFAGVFGALTIGARNDSGCDFGGAASLLGGIGLLGVGLIWMAGLIARLVGWRRPVSSSMWANVNMFFTVAVAITLYGYFFGDGCPVFVT